jgi:hypothetical protein
VRAVRLPYWHVDGTAADHLRVIHVWMQRRTQGGRQHNL